MPRLIFKYAEFDGDIDSSHYGPVVLFLDESIPKSENCLFKTNSNMLNSMAMFTFSILDQKYPIWVSLARNFKIYCLRWNLASILIRICWIRCWCSNFLYWTENFPYFYVVLRLNLVPGLTQTWRIQW